MTQVLFAASWTKKAEEKHKYSLNSEMTQQEAALAGLCVAYVVTSKDDPSLTQTHAPIMWW